MTILPPPPKLEPTQGHTCPAPGFTPRKHHLHGTLWECPACGRWWVFLVRDISAWRSPTCDWHPVRWYDVPARRRIAAHETERWHAQLRMTYQRTTARRHWWDCHPNPRKGRP